MHAYWHVFVSHESLPIPTILFFWKFLKRCFFGATCIYYIVSPHTTLHHHILHCITTYWCMWSDPDTVCRVIVRLALFQLFFQIFSIWLRPFDLVFIEVVCVVPPEVEKVSIFLKNIVTTYLALHFLVQSSGDP